MMSDQHNKVMLPRVESRIRVIRSLRVILDVDLAAQYEVANCDHLQNPNFSKSLPFAFTEHGPIQAANVLVSSQGVEMGMKTESLEISHENFSRNTRLQLRQLLDAVLELTTPPEPPKRPFWFLTHEDKAAPKPSRLTKGKRAS